MTSSAPALGSGLWRTASVDDGLHSCPETSNDYSIFSRKHALKHSSSVVGQTTYNERYHSSRKPSSGSNYYSSNENINSGSATDLSKPSNKSIVINSYRDNKIKKETSKYTKQVNTKVNHNNYKKNKVLNKSSNNNEKAEHSRYQVNDGKQQHFRDLSRCVSVDNFYTVCGARNNAPEQCQPQSMSCMSDTNEVIGSSLPIGRGNLQGSRRWQSEAVNVNMATDFADLALPSVKVLASKFDSMRHQTNTNSMPRTRNKKTTYLKNSFSFNITEKV